MSNIILVKTVLLADGCWQDVSEQRMLLHDLSAREIIQSVAVAPIIRDNSIHFPLKGLMTQLPALIRHTDRLARIEFASVLRGLDLLARDGFGNGATDLIFCESPIRSM